jgi:hypothetical protein
MTAMAGVEPAKAYATLHLSFGLLLLAASAIYLVSRDKRA